jgi:hypothetical protein
MRNAAVLGKEAVMKCAHPGCKCDISADGKFGTYCSKHCQDQGQNVEPHCTCGHPDCK